MTSSPPAVPPSGSAADRLVTLAAIAGAHGVAGDVRLKLFGDDVAALKRYGAYSANGRTLTLVSARQANQGAVARFAEVTDRTAAEALRGTVLTVPRSALPPLADGEYYHHDLIGLMARDAESGDDVGRVVAVENFGAGDILEIARQDGRRYMVPMTRDAVPRWDAAAVHVAPPFIER